MRNTRRPRWLVVSYYANDDGRAASHHIDDRLHAFRSAGIDVTVLSSVLNPRYQNQHHIRALSFMPSALFDELRACMKRNSRFSFPVQAARLILPLLLAIPLALCALLERSIVQRDKRWSWKITAALRGWVWAFNRRPDLILSTGGPACAHEAANWLSDKLDVALVCEFQDPLPFQYPSSNPAIHQYHLELEAKLARQAKALIYLTEGAVSAAQQRFAKQSQLSCSAACFAVLSGAPAKRVAAKMPSQTRVLAHIGTLSRSRNLETIVQALSALAKQEPQLTDRFAITLAGTLDKSVLQFIERCRFKAQIDVLGRLARDELDAVVADSDVLLLIQNTGPIAQETIPSKTFEYLQTGRPILGLIGGNEQLKSLLQEHGHAVYDYGDPVCRLEQELHALLFKPLPSIKPSELTVQRSVDELIKRIDSVL